MSFLVFPASSNYQLKGFTVGNAGGGDLSSSNYEMNANIGEIDNGSAFSDNYGLNAGLIFTLQSNVPTISIDNPNNYYNKLHLTINPQNNPLDSKYAIAISSDNFITTQYVKSDNTIGSTLSITDYQTYSAWGGSDGTFVIGLNPGTTYKVKAKAMQGKLTETGYGPTAFAATINPSLSFDIDVSEADQQTNPPYAVSLGDLLPNAVVGVGSSQIWISLETNAVAGANVFVYSQNGGLLSTTSGYKITSISGNLDIATTGFGIQNSSIGQSLGYLSVLSPYNGYSNNIGILDTSYRNILSTTAPLTSGRASFYIKAKAASDTPSGSDYTDSLTLVAVAKF